MLFLFLLIIKGIGAQELRILTEDWAPYNDLEKGESLYLDRPFFSRSLDIYKRKQCTDVHIENSTILMLLLGRVDVINANKFALKAQLNRV